MNEDAAVTEFFGTKYVNVLIKVALLSGIAPEWMRTTRHLVDLPRYVVTTDTGLWDEKYIIPEAGASMEHISRKIIWVCENLNNPWSLDAEHGWIFANRYEAAHFRLAF